MLPMPKKFVKGFALPFITFLTMCIITSASKPLIGIETTYLMNICLSILSLCENFYATLYGVCGV